MDLEWHGRFSFTDEKVREVTETDGGGNYMILVELKNGNYRPIYVGKAENLRKRLLEHFSENGTCLKKHIEKYTLGMRFCYVGAEGDRKDVEHTLYHKYSHECNEKEPEGKIIEITPPY
ncbi:MAG: GIY-YIG nuclease family protein [Patescibacteria group bacterium]|nr:GIY-YIG nuclease family protein [Patescibacteria group bacterium]